MTYAIHVVSPWSALTVFHSGSRKSAGPRMRLVIALAEAKRGHVRVDLGRCQAAVAQQFLHIADIRASVEQMRCETVPQRVRMGSPIEACRGEIVLEQAADASRGQPRAVLVEKDRRPLALAEKLPARLQPALDRLQGRPTQQGKALTFSLAAHR